VLDLQGYGPSILQGVAINIQAGLLALLLAVLLGMAGALAKLSGSRVARGIASVYTTVVRGVPDLVLMLLVFFGGQMMVNRLGPALGYEDYIDISPFIAGVLTIGFIYGAYMTETFRGAILAVPAGQYRAVTSAPCRVNAAMSERATRLCFTSPTMAMRRPSSVDHWPSAPSVSAKSGPRGLEPSASSSNEFATMRSQPFRASLARALSTTLSVSAAKPTRT